MVKNTQKSHWLTIIFQWFLQVLHFLTFWTQILGFVVPQVLRFDPYHPFSSHIHDRWDLDKLQPSSTNSSSEKCLPLPGFYFNSIIRWITKTYKNIQKLQQSDLFTSSIGWKNTRATKWSLFSIHQVCPAPDLLHLRGIRSPRHPDRFRHRFSMAVQKLGGMGCWRCSRSCWWKIATKGRWKIRKSEVSIFLVYETVLKPTEEVPDCFARPSFINLGGSAGRPPGVLSRTSLHFSCTLWPHFTPTVADIPLPLMLLEAWTAIGFHGAVDGWHLHLFLAPKIRCNMIETPKQSRSSLFIFFGTAQGQGSKPLSDPMIQIFGTGSQHDFLTPNSCNHRNYPLLKSTACRKIMKNSADSVPKDNSSAHDWLCFWMFLAPLTVSQFFAASDHCNDIPLYMPRMGKFTVVRGGWLASPKW